jgi:hypothetical protein
MKRITVKSSLLTLEDVLYRAVDLSLADGPSRQLVGVKGAG